MIHSTWNTHVFCISLSFTRSLSVPSLFYGDWKPVMFGKDCKDWMLECSGLFVVHRDNGSVVFLVVWVCITHIRPLCRVRRYHWHNNIVSNHESSGFAHRDPVDCIFLSVDGVSSCLFCNTLHYWHRRPDGSDATSLQSVHNRDQEHHLYYTSSGYCLHKDFILHPVPQCITSRYRKNNGLICPTHEKL